MKPHHALLALSMGALTACGGTGAGQNPFTLQSPIEADTPPADADDDADAVEQRAPAEDAETLFLYDPANLLTMNEDDVESIDESGELLGSMITCVHL